MKPFDGLSMPVGPLAPTTAAAAAHPGCDGCWGGDIRVNVSDAAAATFPLSAVGRASAVNMLCDFQAGP